MGDQYDVGYGKPPTKSQFKKGKSGNPLGRRITRIIKSGGAKAPLSFETALIAELKSRITVTEAGGRKKKITKLEALAKVLLTDALERDKAAIRYLLALLPKLPHDAFVEDGDGVYTYRYTEAQMEAQKKALEFIINEFGNYKIPDAEQDGPEQEEERDSPEQNGGPSSLTLHRSMPSSSGPRDGS